LSGASRVPDFLVLGAPKTATTTVHRWLEPHPDVFVPEGKELHFFDVHWAKGLASYASVFGGAEVGQIAGEVAASYFAHPHAPDRIAESLPEVRCVALLRDPADRAWSHYWMQQAKWAVTEPFEEMMRRQMADPGYTKRGHARYLDEGRYATHLTRWESLIGRERLLVLLTDDIRERPADIYRELCGFIGVAPGEPPASVGRRFNVTEPVRSPRVRRAMMRAHVGKWLPGPVVTRMDRMNRLPAPPAMPDALRAELVAWYQPELDGLSAWLERPLPQAWTAIARNG
jgi:hypothetical protein